MSGTSSENIGIDSRWGQLYVSNTVAVTPEVNGTSFWVDTLIVGAGTQQVVAAVRDQAGNIGYATNEIFITVVTNAQFGYNAAGCTTNIAYTGTGSYSASLALGWDEKYQLTSVASATSAVSYTYDVLGRRVSCRVSSASQTNTEHYVYNGNQVVADLDESGNLLRTYTWGPGIDNLLSLTVWSGGSGSTPTATYYPLKDHQNSVIALVDAEGNVVESYEYDAYGRTTIFDSNGSEIASRKSAIGNRYLWQGREYDSSTGLYYFRARWYDPVTGRWLSKDPIGISGGLNLYVFCGNNPVNFVDPSGLCKGGTLGIGTSVSFSLFGVWYHRGFQFVVSAGADGKINGVGVIGYNGYGVSPTAGASYTLDVSWSGNTSIQSLGGTAGEGGAGGGAYGGGGGYTYANDGRGGASGVHTVSGGVSTPGPEGHGGLVETTTAVLNF